MTVVNILLPTLFPALARRALNSLMAEPGNPGIELKPVIVGHGQWDDPAFAGIDAWSPVLVDETHPQGVNAALRLGIAHCSGDFVLVACDDVVFEVGWLEVLLEQHHRLKQIMGERPFAIGLRYGPVEQIGTCYGRMYPTFPFFERRVLEDDDVRSHFMPNYLQRSWGDVAFGMALWKVGGAVFDSHSSALVKWHPDRLGCGAAPKAETFYDDTRAFRRVWEPAYGTAWHQHGDLNEFNVNCPLEMLHADTICIPHPASFKNTLHRSLP